MWCTEAEVASLPTSASSARGSAHPHPVPRRTGGGSAAKEPPVIAVVPEGGAVKSPPSSSSRPRYVMATVKNIYLC